MVSMLSQHKISFFLSNFLGDKKFRELKVSADFPVNRPKLRGNCVFSLKWYNFKERVSARKRSHCSPFSYFDLIMFGKRSNT